MKSYYDIYVQNCNKEGIEHLSKEEYEELHKKVKSKEGKNK